ncbi:tRNA1(Val) (adenine(37)-N6)-methyltransferase [Ferrimonas gelatinilytica]|uniref:tRNA1(Val) (adenine(37)-N6)-methyltransferase n=1 Tax=Ferrimonas gelatinilytica TaxID=1255257 RepID=A0ABP9SED0_9GAMM
MPFTFKQFHVDDSRCGMKVSTDAVLLGAWAEVRPDCQLLDIGTGSGVLALMAAQRGARQVVAVELDAAAAAQARENFSASPWPERLQLRHEAIQRFVPDQSFDAILCNPPYFQSGARSERCDRRALARHHDGLTQPELLTAIVRLLSPEGCASLILPMAEAQQLLQMAPQYDLHLSRYCEVRTTPAKPVSRLLLSLSAKRSPPHAESLVIRQSDGRYSIDFCRLTEAFYLNTGSQRP